MFGLSQNVLGEIIIQYKVNDEIITNHDIKKESEYLLALNKNIENLDNDSLLKRSTDSLIREKIKENEINKFYNIDYDKAINSEKIDSILQNLRLNLGFNSDDEFEKYLSAKNINIEELKKNYLLNNFGTNLFLINIQVK